METFIEQPKDAQGRIIDTQGRIIDTALMYFGKYGYKKTSMSDIAKSCGISKGLIFHHFGTKKKLYLALVEHSKEILLEGFYNDAVNARDDLFDRIKIASEMKIRALKNHPYISTFLMSFYLEKDAEVADIVEDIIPTGEQFSRDLVLREGDGFKFKDGVDINIVMRILMLIAKGYSQEMAESQYDYDGLVAEFETTMDLLKNNLYKGEYL